MDRTSTLGCDQDLAESASRESTAVPSKSHFLSMFCSACPELDLFRPCYSEKNQSESIFKLPPLGAGRGATIPDPNSLNASQCFGPVSGAHPLGPSSLRRDSPDPRSLNVSQCFGSFAPS